MKAFNNILAYSLAELGRAEGETGRLAVAIAGDKGTAKSVASALVNEVGFDPVDAGGLQESWRQQPATPAYCCDFDAGQTREALSAAKPGVAPAIRDRMMENYSKLPANATHAEMVAMNRVVNVAP